MQGKFLSKVILGLSLCVTFSTSNAASAIIPMYLINAAGEGESIGEVKVEDSICGVLLTPNLRNLPAGIHGFHIHEKPSCAEKGMAAGGHLDPSKTDKHLGPYKQTGHLGDLPVLIVNADGTATLPTLAPRFDVSTIIGHTLMIHSGSDNYSDTPQKLGGGGDRIACGVINHSPTN